MTKKSERQPIKAENVAGGAGYILKEELIKGAARCVLQDVQ